jgi:hypothetical protein
VGINRNQRINPKTFATWGNSGIVPHEGTGNQLSRNA